MGPFTRQCTRELSIHSASPTGDEPGEARGADDEPDEVGGGDDDLAESEKTMTRSRQGVAAIASKKKRSKKQAAADDITPSASDPVHKQPAADPLLKRPSAKTPLAKRPAATMTPDGFDLIAWMAKHGTKEEAARSRTKKHSKRNLHHRMLRVATDLGMSSAEVKQLTKLVRDQAKY